MITLDDLKKEFRNSKYESGRIDFNDEGIKASIKRALYDFTDRTEKLKPGAHPFGPEEKFKALCKSSKPNEKSFVNRFIDYFHPYPPKTMSETDFDKWHNEMCNEFLSVIRPNYQDGLKYGKAQKIVNMTFKYVYCLKHDGIPEVNFEKYFEHCHMPLDSITLEWVKRTQAWLKCYERKAAANKTELPPYLYITKIPSWSKMDENDIVDEKAASTAAEGVKKEKHKRVVQYGYTTIQKKIREYLVDFADKNPATKYLVIACNATGEDKAKMTPLRTEFFVWKYMQLELAAESIYKQLSLFDVYDEKTEEQIAQNVQTESDTKKGDSSGEAFSKKPINEKLEYLQALFQDIENYKVQEE